ncbi:MAG TPA: 2-oxoacid:acceptor oxidoreductase subunit alpha [Bacillota bacterium]|nr:2-oxoacid:acceptor oxidoreductase subunit alpha [Bacillota bacterium]HPQ10016.1 2-oxoacid:acceptor oxidoreductase subunit alpha [Bacillota bacterium]
MDLTIIVGGAAGQGMQSLGSALVRAGARAGFHVFATQDYMSRIRGGHNFSVIRFAENGIRSVNQDCHLIVAFDSETVTAHQDGLHQDGLIVCDPEDVQTDAQRTFFVPLRALAVEHAGHHIMSNSVALGAVWGLLGGQFDDIALLLEETWEAKGPEIVEKNQKAALAGFNYAKEHKPETFKFQIKQAAPREKTMVIDGATAMGMGAIAAGCTFVSAYPMTPSTSLTEYMAAHKASCGIIVEQVEDEIAAINMGIGAANAGARVLVPTSGGGFSLMVEGLGLAGITETPIVIVNMQRPGPATGLPTRTEQADLLFVIHAHQGEFPRMVMAPHTHEEAFDTMVRAFNVAEILQIPVIVLGDQYLADSMKTTPFFDFSKVEIDRGKLLSSEEGNALGPNYKRYQITADGVSPRAIPGLSRALVKVIGDEHDEAGNITESAEVRIAQHEKRLKKLRTLKELARKPIEYGPKDAPSVLVSWGSTYGPVKEAVDLLNGSGKPTRMVHFVDVYPLNEEHVIKALEGAKTRIAVENNATGQFAKLIKAETGIGMTGFVLRYDGRPLTPEYITSKLEKGGDLPW